jgi:hypothetical protein
VTVAGEVPYGESFEHAISEQLDFHLVATDRGWKISVRGHEAEGDLVYPVTPPLRFDNPRYVGTVYGHSAADAVAWNPREFLFLMHPEDLAEASEAISQLLGPYYPLGLPTFATSIRPV